MFPVSAIAVSEKLRQMRFSASAFLHTKKGMLHMIIVFLIIVIFVLWCISVRRRLAALNENIDHAMSRIGVQLSSLFDVLTALVDLLQGYDVQESQTLTENIKACRSLMTATATSDDVRKQECAIFGALSRISKAASLYPQIKENEKYVKCMNAIDNYEKMIHTSRLIYNDHVTRFNRELRLFPTALLGGILGFHERDYLEVAEEAEI